MNTIETIETIETRKYGYCSGIADMASHRDASVSQKQGDYNAIPHQKQEDYNTIPLQKPREYNTILQQKQHNQSQSDNLLIQQSPKAVPPPPPPRAPRKPILRSYSDAQVKCQFYKSLVTVLFCTVFGYTFVIAATSSTLREKVSRWIRGYGMPIFFDHRYSVTGYPRFSLFWYSKHQC